MGERILVMSFKDVNGKTCTIRLRGAKESLPDTDVLTLMNFIKTNIKFDGVAIESNKEAFVEQTNTEIIELTA